MSVNINYDMIDQVLVHQVLAHADFATMDQVLVHGDYATMDQG